MKSNGKLYWYGLERAGTEVFLETDTTGDTHTEYIFFNGQRIARRDPNGAVHYYFSDHLGSARVVTSATGSIEEESDYYPFGGERIITDSLNNTYKWTGQEFDAELNHYHFPFRQYLPAYGRFVQTDPIAGSISDPQSLNLYAYVRNDPVNLLDPLELLCRYAHLQRNVDPDGNPTSDWWFVGYVLAACPNPKTDCETLGDLLDKLKKALEQSASALCSALPDARTKSVNAVLGGTVSAAVGGGQLVDHTNNTRSLFVYSGTFVGINPLFFQLLSAQAMCGISVATPITTTGDSGREVVNM